MPDRRTFLAGACAALAVGRSRAAEPATAPLRAVVIGHTGRGDYGHGVDSALAGRRDVELLAVADADEAGRAKAVARLKAKRGYADYREMIEKERPQLVAIGPRITPERRDMLMAAVGAKAHVYSEKPFCRTPADGDEVLALAAKNGVRIAVAHQTRLGPTVAFLKKKLDAGALGDLVELRAFGKQDARAGGEDLVVLGVHLFDLMRMLAGGDALWCQAAVWQKGRPATLADVRSATEDIGPILGDQIHATFGFDKGVLGTFTSNAKLRGDVGHWGVEVVGSKGVARILSDIWPRVMVKTAGKWDDAGRTDAWKPFDDDPAANAPAAERSNALANKRVVDDLLAAIKDNREPQCSGANAAKAVEMVHAVWRAGLAGARILLPLTDRAHALGKG